MCVCIYIEISVLYQVNKSINKINKYFKVYLYLCVFDNSEISAITFSKKN